jgi:tetratricopeptide (TPR) repeat protein
VTALSDAPHRPAPAPSPQRLRRQRAGDALSALVLLAAAAVLGWAPALYRESARPFPKRPDDFPPPAVLEKEILSARAALEEDPEDLDALTRLAAASYQMGPDKAGDCIEFGDRALTLGALDDRLFYFTGACFESKGLTDYAAQAFEKYLRHHPGDLEIHLRLGNLYYRMDELEKAEGAFRKVLAGRPGDPLVSFNLAVVLRDRQQWQEGLDVLTPVLERDKTLPAGGFRVLGDLRHNLKDLDGALGAYREEIKRSPDDPELLGAAAQVHEDAGRDADALATWKRVLDLDPSSKQANAKVRALTRKVRRK